MAHTNYDQSHSWEREVSKLVLALADLVATEEKELAGIDLEPIKAVAGAPGLPPPEMFYVRTKLGPQDEDRPKEEESADNP